MKNGNKNHQNGFIKIVVLAIIIIGALVYFNVDVRGFFENPGIQKFVAILKVAWTNYIVPLFSYLWTSVSGLFS